MIAYKLGSGWEVARYNLLLYLKKNSPKQQLLDPILPPPKKKNPEVLKICNFSA